MKILQTVLLIAFSAAVGYFIGVTRGFQGEQAAKDKPQSPQAKVQPVKKPNVRQSQNLNRPNIRTDQRWYLRQPQSNPNPVNQKPIKTRVTHPKPMYPKPIKVKPNRIPFNVVIKEATTHEVYPYALSCVADQEVRKYISQAANKALSELNKAESPVRNLRRINEASRYFEDALLEYLNVPDELSCKVPLNTKGHMQRSGYPDLHITHLTTGKHYYLDPKLYEHSSKGSSLRTFYYSPVTKKGKIHYDAVHFVLGISHDGNDGDWRFLDWQLVDLYNVDLKLKVEYNASNKQLYSEKAIVSCSA